MHLRSNSIAGSLALGALIAVGALTTTAPAYSATAPEGSFPSKWSSLYPNSDSLSNAGCQLCHVKSSGGKIWNGYGWRVKKFMDAGASVTSAIVQCEPLDSDSNPAGTSNLEEINLDVQPGWVPGPHNTHYFKTSTLTDQLPPAVSGQLDPPLWELYGCGTNPAGSMSVVSGGPISGTTFVVGLDNPLGSQTAPAIGVLAISLTPDPGFPCGTLLPGYGMAGPFGELLVGVAPPNPILILVGGAWFTPGTPVPIGVPIPSNVPLVGASLYFQGILASSALTLTEGLHMVIGY